MTEKVTEKRIAIPTMLGIPFDGQSSYLRGAGDAPPKIREAMHCDASNDWTELGVNLGTAGIFDDAGDLAFSEKDAFEVIESDIGKLLDERSRPVSVGGDHSITYPIAKAFARKYPALTIFHFDAHPDLYDEFEGNRLSHACPFCADHGVGAGKTARAGWDSRYERPPAGASAKVRRGDRGDTRGSSLRETEGCRAGVRVVRYGYA